jgi:hypothetical protein
LYHRWLQIVAESVDSAKTHYRSHDFPYQYLTGLILLPFLCARWAQTRSHPLAGTAILGHVLLTFFRSDHFLDLFSTDRGLGSFFAWCISGKMTLMVFLSLEDDALLLLNGQWSRRIRPVNFRIELPRPRRLLKYCCEIVVQAALDLCKCKTTEIHSTLNSPEIRTP